MGPHKWEGAVEAVHPSSRGSFQPGAPVEKIPLFVYGHSWWASSLQNTVGARAVDRIASRLDLGAVTMRAVNGSSVQDVANRVIGQGGAPWVPGTKGIVIIQTGLVEAITPGGMTVLRATSIEENLRAALYRIRSGIFDEIRTGNGWTATGVWTESVAQADGSGNNHTYTQAQGATISKALNAGSYFVDLRTTDGTAAVGGTAEILVGGVVVHTVDLNAKTWDDGAADEGHLVRNVTIPAGDAAARTLAIRKADAGAGFVVVDYVGGFTDTPPAILVVREPLIPTVTQNDVDTVNACIDKAVAGITHVRLVDTRVGWDPTTMIGPDNVHPNDRGSAHVADRVVETLLSLPWRNGMNTL